MDKILILGGYGNAGYHIARLLLEFSHCTVIIAGRNMASAAKAAESLGAKFGTNRVAGVEVNIADPQSLLSNLDGCRVVVVASSTPELTANIASAALESKVDYLDLMLSSRHKILTLNQLTNKITSSGRVFITDGGFHPGLPAALVRYAGDHIGPPLSANVYSFIRPNWKELNFSTSTVIEFAEELSQFDPSAFIDGHWKKLTFRQMPRYDFGVNLKKHYCAPMFLEEMRELPNRLPTLKETGFYVAGFNPLTDYFVLPLAIFAIKLFGQKALPAAGKFFQWSLRHFSRPPYITVLQLDARIGNEKKRITIRIEHQNGYVLTAAPVVACLLQLLDGTISTPGLYFQGNVVETGRFFRDLERMGITITESFTQNSAGEK